MALVVETGSSSETANSYASLAAANAWNAGQLDGGSWELLDDSDKERALITATSLIDDAVEWFGEPSESYQALHWPRVGVLDKGTYLIAPDSIPKALVNATSELARILADRITAGSSATGSATAEQAVQEIVLGEIEIKMQNAASTASSSAVQAAPDPATLPRTVAMKLRGLGVIRMGYGSVRLVR